jgi:hypothetical protein
MTMVGVDMAFPMIHTAKLKVPDGLVVTDAAKRDWFISPMGELEAVPIWWPFYEAPFPGKYFPYNFGHFGYIRIIQKFQAKIIPKTTYGRNFYNLTTYVH